MTLNKNDLEKMKSAVERFSKEELIDLMQHIIKIYVLEQPIKPIKSLQAPQTLNEFSGLSLQQILLLLQENLDLDDLGKFKVTPTTIYVSIGDAEFDFYGPTPQLKSSTTSTEDSSTDEDNEENEEQQDDSISNRPWRRTESKTKNKVPTSTVETPSMAELFANDTGRADRRDAIFSFEPPEAPPPIAENAPGDIVDDKPSQQEQSEPSRDFAKTAENREEQPKAPPPPDLAEGDRQIDPSNRFASLDLD